MPADRWFDDVYKRIESAEESLDEGGKKKYNTALLKRIALRVQSFNTECVECEGYKNALTELSEKLSTHVSLTKDDEKAYHRKITDMTLHMQSRHRLFIEGQNLVIYLPVGAGFGILLGVLLGNVALGIPIGAGLGMTLGIILDTKARKSGKII